jgi:gluconolactonase
MMESIPTPIKTVDRIRAAIDADYARSFNARGTKPAFVVYDKGFLSVFGDTPGLQLIGSRDYEFVHEAFVYIRKTNSVYFTANYQSCNPIELYAVHCETARTTRLNYPSVIQANGACNYQDKVLYCVQWNMSESSALLLVDPVSGEEMTLLNNFHGQRFDSINDVVVYHPSPRRCLVHGPNIVSAP